MPQANSTVDMTVKEVNNWRVATLDSICAEQGFQNSIDLLKIDVQGAEHMVLAGAGLNLRRVRPLWVEVSLQPLHERSCIIEQVIGLCRKHDFIMRRLEGEFRGANGELLQTDALFAQGAC